MILTSNRTSSHVVLGATKKRGIDVTFIPGVNLHQWLENFLNFHFELLINIHPQIPNQLLFCEAFFHVFPRFKISCNFLLMDCNNKHMVSSMSCLSTWRFPVNLI